MDDYSELHKRMDMAAVPHELDQLRALTEEQNGQLAILRGVLERQRNAIIEECVRKVQSGDWHKDYTADPIVEIVAALRSLKD